MKTHIVTAPVVGVIAAINTSCTSLPRAKGPQEMKTGQYAESFDKEIVTPAHVKYLLYVPEEYAASREKWPLILFLHGAGERGDDLDKVAIHGPPKLVAKEGKTFPFIIVSPQCPEGDWWTTAHQIIALNALLDDLVSRFRIDEDRIYLTGLSMGGFGTWALATAYPDRFAAIAPICGGGDPIMTRRIGHIPAWVFHGAKDPVVPVRRAEEMVAALKKADADVTLTVYPEAQHDSWTQTYNNPALYEWFLRHRRSKTD